MVPQRSPAAMARVSPLQTNCKAPATRVARSPRLRTSCMAEASNTQPTRNCPLSSRQLTKSEIKAAADRAEERSHAATRLNDDPPRDARHGQGRSILAQVVHQPHDGAFPPVLRPTRSV